MKSQILKITSLVQVILVWAIFSHCFGFGQNKVQYNRFHWFYLQTEHFDVYYPQNGDTIAQFAVRHVEEMYRDITSIIGHEVNQRVPIILHNTHAEFEQTNVIRLPLHEAIGGFTEIFKNRIVLPFEGDYEELYHVLKHEMVHAVIFDMLYGGKGGSVIGHRGAMQFPLWVNEGLAEYCSLKWDLSSEFFLMDAIASGRLTPMNLSFDGYLAYKGGQMFFYFLESSFGEGTIKRFIKAMLNTRSIDIAFKNTTGISIEETGELWLRELRYIYWPELGQRQHGKQIARRLTHHGEDLSFYNMQPALSPDSRQIAFFSDRDSREGIFILDIETEKIIKSVLEGGSRGKHESFHSFKSGLSWGPQSKRLAIVSKSQGKDVINIIDSKNGDILEEITPDISGILSPNWSRDGKLICFSGINKGFADIYVWNRDTKSLKRLTNDLAYDGKPVFTPSGDHVVFETDRADSQGQATRKYLNIYKINLTGGSPVAFIQSPYDDKMPTYGPSDSIMMYVSNRSGIDNIYMAFDSSGSYTDYPLTNVLAGCFTPSWSIDGGLVAFSVFEQGGWDIYIMKSPLENVIRHKLPETHFIKTQLDTSISFYRSIKLENLTSYKKDTSRTDSTVVDNIKALIIPIKDGEGSGEVASAKDTASVNDGTEKDKNNQVLVKVSLDSADFLDENGKFIKRTYTPVFTLDVAAAALGVSNFDGSFGQGYIVLSDLMGDQEIQIAANLDGNISNSFIAAEYHYLPWKVDYILGGFYRSFTSTLQDRGKELSWGVWTTSLLPLSIFSRWQFDLRTQFIQQDLTLSKIVDSVSTLYNKPVSTGIFQPTLSWSYDNSQWGIVGPVNGERVLISASTVPPVIEKDIFYFTMDMDVRKYLRFAKKYTLALRVNAGFSEAVSGYRNPHKFWLGGDRFINIFPQRYSDENVPKAEDIEGWYNSEFAFPLRGFDYFEFAGNRKYLSNIEFRFPFIKEFTIVWPIPLSIRYVTGVIFSDYGAAWTTGSEFINSQGWGMGYGMRLNLGIFVLRWTRSWAIDGIGNHKKNQRDYWSLGAEF